MQNINEADINEEVDITEYIMGEKKSLLKLMAETFFLFLAADVNTHEVFRVTVDNDKLINRKIPQKWEEVIGMVMEHTIPEHRARIMPYISPSVVDELKDDKGLTVSFRNNVFASNGNFRWVDITINREHLMDRDLVLYKLRDVTEAVNERHTLMELTSRDENTFLLNRYYLAEMIRNEYTRLETVQVILMNFQDIGESTVENSGVTLRTAAEAALSLTRYNCHLYRYTPKEMLVVIQNGTKEDIADFTHDWQVRMDFLMKDVDQEYLLFIGAADGRVPFALHDLIAQCEKEILDKKRQYELANEARDAAERRRLNNRLNHLMKYLDEQYLSIYEVNLENDTYTTIVKNTDKYGGDIAKDGPYEATFNEAIGWYLSDRTREERLRAGKLSNLREALKHENRVECEFETKGGYWRRVVWQLVESRGDEPKRVVMAHMSIDTSEANRIRQQNDIIEAYRRQEEMGEANQQFISRMSHDIRTPLNAIIGMTMLARNAGGDAAKIDSCLKKIDDASGQLLGLVNEILDMTKMQSGQMEVNIEAFNIAALFDGVQAVVEPLMEGHGHEFRIEPDGIEHEILNSDLHRIQRICNNILGNSVKYTPDGGHITMKVSEKPIDDKSSIYHFEFSDDGIGMSEEFQRKIFDPFSRAEDQRVEKKNGTGLGMAITRNLIELLHGTISVESKLDEGTTFIVEIPCERSSLQGVPIPEVVKMAGVLIVCDDSCKAGACTVSKTCLKSLFPKYGVPCEMVTLGQEAIDRVRARREDNNPYITIFINTEKYSEQVSEAIQHIRMEAGALTAIALCVSGEWLSYEMDARSRGVNFFLPRPLFIKTLFDIVNKSYSTRLHADDEQVSQGLPTLTGKRILVAEDNDINAEIIMGIMATTGVTMDRAVNGLDAVDKFRDVPEYWYDMIFMDIEMPTMDGYDATRAIRSCVRPDAKTIPIVAMTANAFASDADKAMKCGMNAHLTKPIEIEKLATVLRDCIL